MMAFTVKIYTTSDFFTEEMEDERAAFQRAVDIMDLGEYVKSTRRGNDIIHDVYKTTLVGRGKTLAVNTADIFAADGTTVLVEKTRFDGGAVENEIEEKDQERVAIRLARAN